MSKHVGIYAILQTALPVLFDTGRPPHITKILLFGSSIASYHVAAANEAGIRPEPLPVVVRALTTHETIVQVYRKLPDILLRSLSSDTSTF